MTRHPVVDQVAKVWLVERRQLPDGPWLPCGDWLSLCGATRKHIARDITRLYNQLQWEQNEREYEYRTVEYRGVP